mmetsp:Transcript_4294/g.11678  ORF Transcript_4294/g.11678 Transcript_4294/m.11678 type:complete len:220 (+) Transcript_4294:144-803(+)
MPFSIASTKPRCPCSHSHTCYLHTRSSHPTSCRNSSPCLRSSSSRSHNNIMLLCICQPSKATCIPLLPCSLPNHSNLHNSQPHSNHQPPCITPNSGTSSSSSIRCSKGSCSCCSRSSSSRAPTPCNPLPCTATAYSKAYFWACHSKPRLHRGHSSCSINISNSHSSLAKRSKVRRFSLGLSSSACRCRWKERKVYERRLRTVNRTVNFLDTRNILPQVS